MENPIFEIMRRYNMNNNNMNNNNMNNNNINNNNINNNMNNNNMINNNMGMNNMNMSNMGMNMLMQPIPLINQFHPMGMNLQNNNNVLQDEDKEKLEISPDDIYNKNEVEKMKELLKCPICFNILISPVQCNKCNNCFCKLCIDKYQDSKIKCPFRCEFPLYLENKFVKNVLAILKFKCKNGCNQIIKYDDLEKHYEEECEKIDYKTKYKDILKKYKELKKEYDKIKPNVNNMGINNMQIGMMNNNMGMNNNMAHIIEMNNHIIQRLNNLDNNHNDPDSD